MSFPKYEAYKDSGVEWLREVPEHWALVPLKWLCELVTTKATDTSWQIGLENVESWSGRFVETESEFAGSGLEFVPNDILFGKLRPYLAKVYLAGHSGEAVGDFFVLRPRMVLARYLHKYILSPSVIHTLNASTIGAKMPRVSWEEMGSLPIVVPTQEEQTQIARFLDYETARIDALIAEQERLIELLKEKRQAVISHAVTKGLDAIAPMKDSGVEWLGEMPAHWEIKALNKAITKITNGYVGPTRDILIPSGVPYIQATHIKRGVVNFDDAYFVRPEWSLKMEKSILKKDDVLIVQTGAGTGDVGLVSEEEEGYNCHALIIIQTIKSLMAGSYLAQVLQSTYGQSVLFSIRTGGMHPHLNCSEVKYTKIPTPPVSEQIRIVQFIEHETARIDALVEEAKNGVELLQERRSALISAAVTGKIDVRGWQPPASAAPAAPLEAACG